MSTYRNSHNCGYRPRQRRKKTFVLSHTSSSAITIVKAYSLQEAIEQFTSGFNQPIFRLNVIAVY